MSNRWDKTLIFFLERFKENEGGFGATPLLPSTLEDTFFGIKTMNLLKPSFLEEKKDLIRIYIDKIFEKPSLKIKHLFQISEICKILNISLPQNFSQKVDYCLTSSLPQVTSIYLYALWNLGKILSRDDLLTFVQIVTNKLPFKTIEDLYFLGTIREDLWKANRFFVIKSQNGDGGFGFYPGTTSFLENTYYALKILFKIDPKKDIIAKGLNFLKACSNSDGGFGRKPGGISYLNTTSMAVEILFQIV